MSKNSETKAGEESRGENRVMPTVQGVEAEEKAPAPGADEAGARAESAGEAGAEGADFEEFTLDDIEVIESKVFA